MTARKGLDRPALAAEAILSPRPQSIVVMQRFCKPQSLVRFRVGAPPHGSVVESAMRHARPLLLLLLACTAWTSPGTARAQTDPCARLCGAWSLDPAASTDVTTAIATTVDAYKEDKPRHARGLNSNDIAVLARAEVEESLGPLHSRPSRDELRDQLQRQVRVPATVSLRLDDDVLVVDEGGSSPRRFEPGRPYSRVDSVGTARITIRFKGPVFEVIEDYGKGRSNRETYAADTKGTRLVVTRAISRPGMKDLKVQSIYVPAAPG